MCMNVLLEKIHNIVATWNHISWKSFSIPSLINITIVTSSTYQWGCWHHQVLVEETAHMWAPNVHYYFSLIADPPLALSARTWDTIWHEHKQSLCKHINVNMYFVHWAATIKGVIFNQVKVYNSNYLWTWVQDVLEHAVKKFTGE